jgi:hypothetical protein
LKLPNPDRAIVDIAKLRTYCLDPCHPEGGHKARVFEAALGLSIEDAVWLRKWLLDVAHEDARYLRSDEFGVTYAIDFELSTPAGSVVVRSGWIVRHGEDFPRLTTCFVPK